MAPLHILASLGAIAGAFVGWSQYTAELMPLWVAILCALGGAAVPYLYAFFWAFAVAGGDKE
jgi:hypothetical protein